MKLASQNVPAGLRHLIPLAEEYGITDDGYRGDRMAKATSQEIIAIKEAIEKYDDLFDSWLAGPEADSDEYSMEYLAFSALRMAADEL